ncbi:PP2C family protein-serine/threonine phosphatase [Neisseria sp. Ec49-e6-T10]|uniref:PP2C family protein-serine/threonine phosphatase n=1 Tax=Neisseria sp. Ec49-e6-T10 TaxID=3140744 RepID=UPI003EBF869B
MSKDNLRQQINNWITRKTPKNCAVSVADNFPIAIASDIGLVRNENQDKAVLLRAQVTPSKSFIVGVLCDGIGGMPNGTECASLAVSSFISSCIQNRNLNVDERLLKATYEANQSVFNKYEGNGGATLSAFIYDNDGNTSAVNIGDSRIYCFTGHNVTQLSVDDTIAGQLKQLENPSEMSYKLLQYVGIGDEIEVHQISLPNILSIKKLLLTSDGVHSLPIPTFNTLVAQDISSFELAKRLISVSSWSGGSDNSTTIVISELSTLLSNNTDIATGTVQLWDSNGSAYFIGIEKISTVTVEKDTSTEFSHHTSNVESTEQLHPRNEFTPRYTINRRRTGKPKKQKTIKEIVQLNESIEEQEKKPQLRIDFDDK